MCVRIRTPTCKMELPFLKTSKTRSAIKFPNLDRTKPMFYHTSPCDDNLNNLLKLNLFLCLVNIEFGLYTYTYAQIYTGRYAGNPQTAQGQSTKKLRKFTHPAFGGGGASCPLCRFSTFFLRFSLSGLWIPCISSCYISVHVYICVGQSQC